MALPRSPGDNTTKTRSVSTRKLVTTNGVTRTNVNVTQQWVRDFRPSYGYGSVITLPGGSTFRRATDYSRRSIEIQVKSAAHRTATSTIRPSQQIVGYDTGTEVHGLIAGNPVFGGTVPPTSLRNEAVTKALTKIADQKVNLGENLATMRQTLGMFTGKASALLSALQRGKAEIAWKDLLSLSSRDLVASAFNNFGKSIRASIRRKWYRNGALSPVAQAYLEYVYGLKPLVQDVFALSELLKKQGLDPLLLFGKGSGSQTYNRGAESSPLVGTFVYREDVTAQLRATCRLWARIDPNWKGLRALNQLGLLNPAGLAWDLVPYSFVVDWFVPVGPMLYALSAPAGLIFVDGSISFRNSETQKFRFYVKDGEYNYALGGSNSPGTGVVLVEAFNRDSLGNWPIPGLYFRSDPLSGDRALKALALAITRLRW